MTISIRNTYSIYESINHFYLNRGKADNDDNNDKYDNEIMIGNPQLEMTHMIK